MVKIKNSRRTSTLPANPFQRVNQHDHGIDLLDPEQVRALCMTTGKEW